jgi:uncharacterized membrane protein YcaP (DUF421 family)
VVLHDLVQFGWIDIADKAIRTVAVYAAVLAVLRFFGKRQLAQLNAFDLVVVLLLSNVVQNAIIGPDNSLVGGLVGAVVLVAVNSLVVRAAFRYPWLSVHLQGNESRLVSNGRIQEQELRRELISPKELEAALRRQGVDGVSAVEEVELMPEGDFFVQPKPQPSLAELKDVLERIERKIGASR